MKKLSFILFLFLLLSFNLFAVSFHHLNVEDGLSSGQVFQISKDSTGFVWMLTNKGIDRYDGSEFRHYQLDKTIQSPDQILFSSRLIYNKNHEIWVATRNGNIYSYDRETDIFNLQVNLSSYFSQNIVLNDFFFDHNDRLWLCLSSGLYLFDTKIKKLTAKQELAGELITCITETKEKTFYVGTNTHLYCFRETADHLFSKPEEILLPKEVRIESFYQVRNKLYVGTFADGVFIIDQLSKEITSLKGMAPGVPVSSFAILGSDQLLIGTDGSGLYQLDIPGNQLLHRYTSDEDDKGSLCGNTISGILVDESERIWISTSTNGISVLDPKYQEMQRIRHEYKNQNSLVSNHVNAILEDSEGDMWYGTNSGVSLYESKSNKWTHFFSEQKNGSGQSFVALALCEDQNKNIWVGGYGIGVFCIHKKERKIEEIKSVSYVFSIFSDNEYMWLGGIEDKLIRYDIRTKKSTSYPATCIGNIKNGKNNTMLFAGCGGLGTMDKTTGNIVWQHTFNKTSLRTPVRCVIQLLGGEIWMATGGDGLVCFDPETGLSETFTVDNGLESNNISSLMEDKKGNLWFCTEKNLYFLDLKTRTLTNMNEFLRVEWGHYNDNACLLKRNGNLAFGTAKGVIEFSSDFDVEPEDSVRLLFTDLKLPYKSVRAGSPGSPLKKAINETSSISLNYEQNSFSISFSVLDFVHTHQIEYRYQLEGFDTDWRQAELRHSVDYMNLPSGKYIFKLEAVNKYTKKVIAERSIKITIDRPLWLSNWDFLFYFCFIFLFVFLLVQYARDRIVQHNSKEKIRFFIDIAHDLRTPVSLIKAPLSELESRETLSEYSKKLLSVASKNADKLFMLVTQLLDLQKVGMNEEAVSLRKQDVYSYMHEKIIAFRTFAEQKGIDLYLEMDSDFPEIRMDKEKMDKIIDNLLSNAIKYTEKGFVSVIVKCSEKQWTIEIQDTGIGIPAGEQKNLFRQFYRAENAVNSNETGSGIGLVLAKKLVDLLQGSITFSSVENSGTSFVLTFPLEENLPMQRIEKTETTPSIEESEAIIDKEVLLLAEDDDDMRNYLTESLSDDYHVISVANGSKALELAKEINPDIIVSDVLMPGLRGDEVCRMLKSSMETSHIPFILLSALSEKENIILGLESGANDYIIKPFDFNILKARIRNILQSRERLRKEVLSDESDPENMNYANQLDREFLDKAYLIIEAGLSDPEFSINEFCKEIGMSRTSVYNKIKALTNQAPNDFIRIIRLNKAKELLKSKQYTIAEVSDMVGFSDPKYFSTSFKKQFGVSPSKLD